MASAGGVATVCILIIGIIICSIGFVIAVSYYDERSIAVKGDILLLYVARSTCMERGTGEDPEKERGRLIHTRRNVN